MTFSPSEPQGPQPPAVIPQPSVMDIRKAIGPLRLIFWGSLICVMDFRLNGFDVLNDALGMLLILIAVFTLAKFEVSDHYRKVMTFVRIIAALSVFRSLVAQVPGLPDALSIILAVIGILGVIATVAFCAAMRWLCNHHALNRSVQSWQVTGLLYLMIYLIPLGPLYLVGIVFMLMGRSYHYNSPWILLLLPVFFAPIVHLLISTSRMKREAQARETSFMKAL